MSTNTSGKLALLGGRPVRDPGRAWPTWPIFDDTERRAVNEVLESGKWWFGERVKQFETDYAAFQDAAYCVTCSSGTAAAEICFQAMGIGPGDEVVVPPYTFVATASSVLRVGATPIFADVDESWCLSPDAVEAAITPRTKAVVPVHFAGRIADMDRLNEIAARHGLIVMEDACHSWGSKWKGKGTGALGNAGVFSFQNSKNITAAEGGAILTDGEDLAERCRAITNCGRLKGAQWYAHSLLGTNARMTEFAAAILSAQLTRLEKQTLLREQNAAILDEGLRDIEGVAVQPGDPRITRRGYHLYCVRIDPDAFGCTREKFVAAAEAEGLPIGAGYGMPLYKQPVMARYAHLHDYSRDYCPVTEDLCYRSGMWFVHQLLLGAEDDMQDIVAIFKKIKAHAKELKEEG
ncbi:MAG TPA: DegT/DnrJ/EryC1/StrS family aminotransferase [Candidatus Hydrogenedentes bacterium]|nr:DegT/DnrJ/EryC1/StrS family aminotransferase [Candidatus Hydrogenedentota bacterium]